MNLLQKNTTAILGKRQKQELRKNKSVINRLFWALKFSFGVLTIVLVSLSYYWIKERLYYSPRFDIAFKEINGLEHISQSLVLLKINELEEQSQNILTFDLSKLRSNLELLPWVKEAAVRRSFPDKLVIDIEERVPIAFARIDRDTVLIDEGCVILQTNPETLPQFDFPVILGIEYTFEADGLSRNKGRIILYRRLLDSLDGGGAQFSQDLSEVHLEDLGNVSVILDGDTVLVHLGSNKFQEKFRKYLALSRELKRKYKYLDSVDLRYKNQMVIRTLKGKFTKKEFGKC